MTALGDFSPGDVLAAADLNAIGEWTTYTATVGGIPVSGQTCRYIKLNKCVIVLGEIVASGSETGNISVSLPFASTSNRGLEVGTAFLLDTGTNIFFGRTLLKSSTEVYISAMEANTTFVEYRIAGVGAIPFAWANGDKIQFNVIYEVA